MIPMRDGTKLYTPIYLPVDSSADYPILMMRTPYSCAPYGETIIKRSLGPNPLFAGEPYIYVYQDVRGRFMSEGQFEEMTPAIDNKQSNMQSPHCRWRKKDGQDTDFWRNYGRSRARVRPNRFPEHS